MHCEPNHAPQKIKCLKCGSHNLIEYSDDRIVCADCGFVNAQNVSSYNDAGVNEGWKSAKQSKALSERGEYGMENVASLNASFSLNELEELIKELRVSDSIERNMALTLHEITKIVFDLSLPGKVLMEAVHIYGELAKKCRFKGKSLKALAAAIVYLAGKKAGLPCGMREVAHVASVPCNKIFKCCEFILEQLGEIAVSEKVEAYVHRVCSLVGVKDKTFEVAERIMLAISQSKYGNGKSLPGMVSASIYIASKILGNHITQRQLAEVTRMTEATIRARCKDIIKNFLFVLTV